jgi:two-component system response regulator
MEERTILLVEDDPNDVLLTLRALKKNSIGGEVVVARDGVEALEYLFGANSERDTGVIPQLVLLDLRLPKIDGVEVLRCLREKDRTRSLPVVIMTSSEGERGMIAGYGLRADLCIERAVDFARFSRELRRLKPLLDEPNGTGMLPEPSPQ